MARRRFAAGSISSLADFAQLAGVTCIDADLLISSLDDINLPAIAATTVTGSAEG